MVFFLKIMVRWLQNLKNFDTIKEICLKMTNQIGFKLTLPLEVWCILL